MSQPFSQQAINENEALITDMCDRLVQRIVSSSMSSQAGTIDVMPLCKLFSLEVICKAAFDKDIAGCSGLSAENALTYLQAMEDTPFVLIMSAVFPFLRSHRRVGQRLPGRVGHSFRQAMLYEHFTRSLFHDFRQKSEIDSIQRFMATPLLRTEDAYLGRKLTEDEAIEEAMGLAFAGSGTTSSTLIYLFYTLSRPEYRHVQLKLRQELHTRGRKLAEIKDLPYLNAVIKETMRLYPTIISTLPRVLDSPLQVDDHIVIPAGTTVGMQNYVHHRDPSVYADPHSFNPERWIVQDSEAASDLEKAFTPFSLGPRNCIGQNLARAELLLATSLVFGRLDLHLSSTTKESDMEMEDRFAVSPRGRKLLLDVSELF